MNKQEAKNRIDKLIKEISHHRYLYHVLDKQEISDSALDSLKKELFDLEKEYPKLLRKDSPTQRVSGKALDKFKKVKHSTKILSLADAFNYNDLKNWEERNEKILKEKVKDYYTELKLDGLTVVLTYINGVLAKGATRGDGKVGEDVTNNLKTMPSIPLSLKGKNLPREIEVRGEVVMNKKVFNEINRQRKKKGLSVFANPRNIAAGSIRQLNPNIARDRRLDCIVFELITDLGQKDHEESHEILKDLGFKTSPYNEKCKNICEVDKYLKKWVEKRKSLPYETDGSVIVVNNIKQEKILGHIGKAERWMIAFKFPAEQVTTKVLDIEVQVGRTGALTPVAVLKPVSVAGSIVSRATLHNIDEIKRLDVRIGDTVIIQKAGDIIPDIVKVLVNLRTKKEKKYRFPKVCPACHSKVKRKDNEVAYYCSNSKCYAKNIESLIHFVSKKGYNIEGLGNSIIKLLSDKGLIITFADIFRLKKGDLLSLEGFAEKKVNNTLSSIQECKEVILSRFIYSLGIRHVGEETAISLAKHFKHFNSFKNSKKEELEDLQDIGPEVAKSIVKYFEDKYNIKVVEDLFELGIKIKEEDYSSNILEGKTFVFTGSLSVSRDKAKSIIRKAGGKVVSSVSKGLDYLVIGKKPGSKLKKAEDLNIKIITEKELLKYEE